MKYRFESSVIEKLLKIRWWDWSEEKLKEAIAAGDFDCIKDFVEKYNVE